MAKINLLQLRDLFLQSAANEELPKPIRQFAAQLTILTTHVGSVAKMVKDLEVKLDAQIAELAMFLGTINDSRTKPPATPVAEEAPPVEDDETSTVEKIMREADAEAAASNTVTKKPNGTTEGVTP